jgi:Mitochondrial mRNA-processing protein COX24, C-terminal
VLFGTGFVVEGIIRMGSVVKKRRKRMAKKKHRKLLRKTRVQRRRLGK